MRIAEPHPENNCFGCGGANAQGMKLTFEVDDETPRAIGRFVLPPQFSGAPGYAHGGIVATILDEAMGKLHHGVKAMTADLRVEYRRPVPIGEEIVVEAKHVSRQGRNILHAAEIRNAAGDVLARGEARFVELSPAHLEKMAEAAKSRIE